MWSWIYVGACNDMSKTWTFSSIFPMISSSFTVTACCSFSKRTWEWFVQACYLSRQNSWLLVSTSFISSYIYIYIYKCVRVSIVNVLRTYIFIHKYHTHIFCSSTLFILPTPTTDTLTYTDTRTRTHTRTYTHIYTYSLSISLSLFPSQLSQANKLCTWRFVDNRELWQRKTLLWIEKKREKV